MLDEALIKAVRNYPELYDARLKCYKDIRKKEQAWKYISAQVKEKESECRYRWKCLRDKYVRDKKKMEVLKKAGTLSSFRMWPLMGNLRFLNDSIVHRSSFRDTNIHDNSLAEEDQDIEAEAILREIGNGSQVEDDVPQKEITVKNECAASNDSFDSFTREDMEQTSECILGNIPSHNSTALQIISSTGVTPIQNSGPSLCSEASSCQFPNSSFHPNTQTFAIAPETIEMKMDSIVKCIVDAISATREKLSDARSEAGDDELFLLSLKPYFKALDDRSKSVAKMKILEILHNLQFQ